MNNYITVLIDAVHKTIKGKTHLTISEVHSQRIPKGNINRNHRDRSDNNSNCMRTWCRRLTKKPGRLTYK